MCVARVTNARRRRPRRDRASPVFSRTQPTPRRACDVASASSRTKVDGRAAARARKVSSRGRTTPRNANHAPTVTSPTSRGPRIARCVRWVQSAPTPPTHRGPARPAVSNRTPAALGVCFAVRGTSSSTEAAPAAKRVHLARSSSGPAALRVQSVRWEPTPLLTARRCARRARWDTSAQRWTAVRWRACRGSFRTPPTRQRAIAAALVVFSPAPTRLRAGPARGVSFRTRPTPRRAPHAQQGASLTAAGRLDVRAAHPDRSARTPP